MLRDIHTTRSNFDANIYDIYNDGDIVIFMLYVKNLFITRINIKLIIWLKNYLQIVFDMVDLKIIQ